MKEMTETDGFFKDVPYYDDDEAYPVTRITAGAVGQPGRRVFVLQAHIGTDAFSWVIEKEQAVALSRAIPDLLTDVDQEYPELHEPIVAADPDLKLSEPLRPLFRVGSMGVSYDRLHDLIVLTLVDARFLQAALDEDESEDDEGAGADDEDDEDDVEQRIYTTRGQAILLGQQAGRVVVAGRPLCPGCGEPMDDFGHFCLPAQQQARGHAAYFH